MLFAPVHAQTSLEVNFEGVYSLPFALRQPVRELLERFHAQHALSESDYIVSAYRDTSVNGMTWAKVTLVPTRYVDAGWTDIETIDPFVLEILAISIPTSEWRVFLMNDPAFSVFAPNIPRQFIDAVSPRPPLAGEYRFPWRAGHMWWAIQGWHDGNALDFQPTQNTRYTVLAAESGHLREICSDGTQSLLQIRHADGRSTYYLHVTMNLSVRRMLLDQNIERGQVLGELIRYAPFVTPCGRGFSRHLHFVVSDRDMLIEGMSINEIAAGASCCANPPRYTSSNDRIDRTTQ